jgi:Asp-tRNA(Asn)/Glu-tRNA(Gln) amidotransferase C subunit
MTKEQIEILEDIINSFERVLRFPTGNVTAIDIAFHNGTFYEDFLRQKPVMSKMIQEAKDKIKINPDRGNSNIR